ncbi:MAG: rhomboid family intramembrane serine protease [Actinobacteria bacterium]|nr:rhomboid family intramembrane serine protease [Actinomycetota bacterium]
MSSVFPPQPPDAPEAPQPPSGESLPPDFETRLPDDLQVQHCYRHPQRETGVSCSNCGRPICHECMIDAPVGFRCPECVKQQNAGGSRAKVVTRGEIRSRWGSGGGVMSGGAPVTRVLIGINVALFLAELLFGAVGIMGGGSTAALVDMGALVPAYVAVKHEYWRLFTAMWLHGGLLHVAFNMYALYIGGSYLEMIAGKGKYLAIYLIAGVAGNVAVFLLAAPISVTIGASTAIFGIFGALFTYSLHNRNSAVGRALSSMGTVILINLVITFVVPGISWQGHVGGLVGGVIAVEALTWFGQRDLRAPFGARDAALLAVVVVLLVAAVLWRTANFPLA